MVGWLCFVVRRQYKLVGRICFVVRWLRFVVRRLRFMVGRICDLVGELRFMVGWLCLLVGWLCQLVRGVRFVVRQYGKRCFRRSLCQSAKRTLGYYNGRDQQLGGRQRIIIPAQL